MTSMRIARTQILRMNRGLDARPIDPVQFTAQVRQTAYGDLEDSHILSADELQNDDGTINSTPDYDDPLS